MSKLWRLLTLILTLTNPERRHCRLWRPSAEHEILCIVFKGIQETKKQRFAALSFEQRRDKGIPPNCTRGHLSHPRDCIEYPCSPFRSILQRFSKDHRGHAADAGEIHGLECTAIDAHHVPQKSFPAEADCAIAAASYLWQQPSRPASTEGIAHDSYLSA